MEQPDPNKKPVKYLKQRIAGKTKKQSEKDVYGVYNHNGKQIEKTQTFKDAVSFYLMNEKEAMAILNRNLRQNKDKGASNKAFEMYARMKQLFPKDTTEFDTGDLQITISKK